MDVREHLVYQQGGGGVLSLAVVSALTSAGVCLVMLWAIGKLPSIDLSSGDREVPALVGLPAESAAELLKGRDLRLVVREQRRAGQHKEGTVLEQSPLSGSLVEAGAEVAVVVVGDAGNRVTVPALRGKTREEAERALVAAGLALGEVRGEVRGEAEEGARVVASRPGAGGELARGEPVVIELAAPRIEVPRLVGLRWPEARRVLERAGLRPGVVRERYDDRRKALVVLEQEPAAGRRVEKASRVDVVRNEGD